jgi:hypothetical protein
MDGGPDCIEEGAADPPLPFPNQRRACRSAGNESRSSQFALASDAEQDRQRQFATDAVFLARPTSCRNKAMRLTSVLASGCHSCRHTTLLAASCVARMHHFDVIFARPLTCFIWGLLLCCEFPDYNWACLNSAPARPPRTGAEIFHGGLGAAGRSLLGVFRPELAGAPIQGQQFIESPGRTIG